MVNKIEPGVITQRNLDGVASDYYAYVPRSGQRQGRVFVTVHGISRNATEHMEGFAAQAERYGAVMLAPHFPEEHFPRYQRIGASMSEGRADLAFDVMMRDAVEWLGIEPAPLHIFGFSGGAQFVHRYALFYPRQVAAMVLGAAGWYTFPDPNQRFPLGIRGFKEWPNLRFSLDLFLAIPTLVLVGDADDIRDRDLNKMRRIDASQGLNRVVRAQRWVGACRAMARAFDVPCDFRLETVPNANHAYESYLAHPTFDEQVFSFLFASP